MANPIQATKIILDDKPIGKKSLNLKDNLIAIRKNITEKVKEDFIFLDIDHKDISPENEENFILEQISKQKTIYIKKVETNRPKIKILVNKKEICSINYSESQNLQEIRNLFRMKHPLKFQKCLYHINRKQSHRNIQELFMNYYKIN